MLIISIIINIGMWYERFIIVVSSLSHTFLPATWTSYSPTIVDIGIYVGTFGIFFTGILLFLKYIPSIAINETKAFSKKSSH